MVPCQRRDDVRTPLLSTCTVLEGKAKPIELAPYGAGCRRRQQRLAEYLSVPCGLAFRRRSGDLRDWGARDDDTEFGGAAGRCRSPGVRRTRRWTYTDDVVFDCQAVGIHPGIVLPKHVFPQVHLMRRHVALLREKRHSAVVSTSENCPSRSFRIARIAAAAAVSSSRLRSHDETLLIALGARAQAHVKSRLIPLVAFGIASGARIGRVSAAFLASCSRRFCLVRGRPANLSEFHRQC